MTRSSPSGAPGSEGIAGPAGRRLPPAARIRRGRDVRRVLRTGNRISGPRVDVFVTASPGGHPRMGVIVPRYGHTAVARNRVRRRLRELARREWLPALRGGGQALDVILRAKPGAYGTSYRRLRDSLTAALGRVCAG